MGIVSHHSVPPMFTQPTRCLHVSLQNLAPESPCLQSICRNSSWQISRSQSSPALFEHETREQSMTTAWYFACLGQITSPDPSTLPICVSQQTCPCSRRVYLVVLEEASEGQHLPEWECYIRETEAEFRSSKVNTPCLMWCRCYQRHVAS